MLAELSIFPTDKGESVSKYVAEVVKYIGEECRRKGMGYETNSMATIIEGNPRDVWEIIIGCHNFMGASSSRYYSVIKIDDRKGRTNAIVEKKAKIEQLINR
ncbi:MTH1187 family thiamine-binding protein [Candidatus Pacearchaeota archaeon]|nr:MTH1187 family thiamine-binding protein [Candidatus Pacearchaeota archaeon]